MGEFAEIGSIVHAYAIGSRNPGECRPAIVVKRWGETVQSAVQLVLFVDGSNDFSDGRLTHWRTSVQHQRFTNGAEAGFHFPSECGASPA